MVLKEALKTRLLVDMIGEIRAKVPEEEFICIVVDRHTSKILSSCARMYDVMEAGVLILENLALCREKLDFHAIYFLENSNTSIKRLMHDFPDNKKRPQYKAVHLYFTGRVSNDQMKRIQGRKRLVQRIQTFKEINVDFISYESRIFTLFRPNIAIKNLYLHNNDQKILGGELAKTASQIVSLCLTLKENPYIRYWGKSKAVTDISKGLAGFVNDHFKIKLKEELSNWKRNDKRERGTLLIVDRSIDPAAPLMHEYTYQAMVNDLLAVNGELCELSSEEKKSNAPSSVDSTSDRSGKKGEDGEEDGKNTVVLSEDDNLWNKFRHAHIATVSNDISEQFNQFKEKNALAKQRTKQTKDPVSIKNMTQQVKALPEYKLMVQKFLKHMNLVNQCMDLLKKYSLSEIGDLEQDMATGLTDEGKSIVIKATKQKLVQHCQSDKIGVIEKVRILMIFLISQGGIKSMTLKELMKTIDPRLQEAINNLPKLGVDIEASKNNKNHVKARKDEFEKHNMQQNLTLMRYIPYIHSIVTNFVSNTLSEDEFPYIEAPSAEARLKKKTVKTSKRWGQRNNGEEKEDNRPLFIVFIIGGMSFSEMRSIYQIAKSQKANLILGGSNAITAAKFVRGLAKLSRSDFAHAIHESGANAASDQDIPTNPDSESENESDFSDNDDGDEEQELGMEEMKDDSKACVVA